MEKTAKNVTIFVDGSVLKRHMFHHGQIQTPQLLVQYLSHMVRSVRQREPDAQITIQYYGTRSADPVKLPISGNNYVEPVMKTVLNHYSVPDAILNNAWGRVVYPFGQPWILRPESFEKTELTDSDFVLNERPKGVLSQLVCKMAETAVRSPETPLYVYGDPEDMAYAMHTSQWFGSRVHQIELEGKTPIIREVGAAKEPRACDKDKMLQMGAFLNTQSNVPESMRNLRKKCPPQAKKSVFLMDLGVIRGYLESKGCRLNAQNVQGVLDQIHASLPEKPSQTVLYYAFATPKKLISPFPGKAMALVDSAGEKQILSIPGVEISAGKTIQDKWYPAILKKEKWHVPMALRGYKDFDYNFHQCDVDDRIAYDIALHSMDPTVSQLYLMATDGDFVSPVEQAAQMGLPTTLIHFDQGARDLSALLQKWADTTIKVTPNADSFVSRRKEKAERREEKSAKSKSKLKQLQKMQRRFARSEEDDYLEPRETKTDRWGAALSAHKREKHERIIRRHRV